MIRLPVAQVLVVATTTQSLTTLGVLALAAVAPKAAADLGVSPALVGYQVGAVYFAGMLSSLIGGGLVRRLGAARTSQIALWVVAAGCLLSALGALTLLALGALVMGIGYGLTNPAASHLLARAPTTRHMNLIFSVKQTGVPIGGVLSGVVLPPLALALGWQAGLVACALALVGFSAAIGVVRTRWDADRVCGAPVLAAPFASLGLIWRHKPLRWLAFGSFVYSAVQLCLTGFLVTYLVAEAKLDLVLAGTLLAITHAAGALGRLVWGWLADRLRSGPLALILNGGVAMAGALATAAIAAGWPLWAIAAAVILFGFSAMGWNGVFMAVIARHSPAQTVGMATGGSLAITYAGVMVGPPAFAALHDQLGFTYGAAYALLALVSALGIACLVQTRRSIRQAQEPAGAMPTSL
jgi:MFS family permease